MFHLPSTVHNLHARINEGRCRCYSHFADVEAEAQRGLLFPQDAREEVREPFRSGWALTQHEGLASPAESRRDWAALVVLSQPRLRITGSALLPQPGMIPCPCQSSSFSHRCHLESLPLSFCLNSCHVSMFQGHPVTAGCVVNPFCNFCPTSPPILLDSVLWSPTLCFSLPWHQRGSQCRKGGDNNASLSSWQR